ncbi:sodium:solute symporter family protein [Tichowtungia aerotolerans]|uniref:sodium:solute symporter family protein n=1 Tax=Tichowtungia aerotolerans TaxID=2697043 RepID=UPI001E5CEBA3|nr:sodium:solute symporter family protein [Tichowtungia aerotolerans]
MIYLTALDWSIIGTFFVTVIIIGIWQSRQAGKSSADFFLGGRGMPWWLLGISMVACTFAADTPNLVCGLVREGGVAKNWYWWAFLITGMITVFVYAKLWRRSGVMTDLEFYELRYGGRPAAVLRGFRAVYLGMFFNVLIMAAVTLAIIKYGQLLFGFSKLQCVVFGSVGVVIYATLGGIKGCIWADFFQYSIAMFGAVWAAIASVKDAGAVVAGSAGASAAQFGLSDLLSHPNVAGKLRIFPDLHDPNMWVPMLLMPLAVQWWAAWYPGAEPGGGGYIAQRMLSAKDEKNAIGATLFFNFAHYALRPWPWIIVALASLVVYPEVADIQNTFPHIDPSIVGDDIAYPAMISRLSPGFLGLVIASIIAAYMSTIGTHLNWGSSYAVNDFYKRFVKKDATEKEMVRMGRTCTVVLMVFAGGLSMLLTDATQAFNLLLLSGAGSGAIYLLRWFWWRINAWSEISAMIFTTLVAAVLTFGFNGDREALLDLQVTDTFTLSGSSVKFLIAVLGTTIAWIAGTLLTRPESEKTLRSFYRKCQPGGPGWKKLIDKAVSEGDMIDGEEHGKSWEVPLEILCVFIGCVFVYSALFCIGSLVYANVLQATVLGTVSAASGIFIFVVWKKLHVHAQRMRVEGDS